MDEGAKFCPNCGRQAVPLTQPPYQNTYSQNTANRRPDAPKQNNRVGLKVFLIVALVAVLGYGVPELLKDKHYREGLDRTAESKTSQQVQDKPKVIQTEDGIVSAERHTVTLCGVTIDVPPMLLKDGSQPISVSIIESSVDAEGIRREHYELNMGPHHQFDAPVEVTFPCTIKEGFDPVVMHNEPESGGWKTLFSYVDKAQGTVSAYFGSFSEADVAYLPIGSNIEIYSVKVPDKTNMPYVKYIEVSDNYWNNALRINPESYEKEIEKFKLSPNNFSVKLPNLTPNTPPDSLYQIFQQASETWTYIDPIINLRLESLPIESKKMVVKFFMDHSDGISQTMNVMPFAIMGIQLYHDMNEQIKNPTKKNKETTAINMYKGMLGSSGTLYSLSTGYSHLGFSLAFFGVAVMGTEIFAFGEAAQDAQYEMVKNAFDTYYTEISRTDSIYWFNVFQEAYYHNNGRIQDAMDEIDEHIDDYCNKFWTYIYTSNNDKVWETISASQYRTIFERADEETKRKLTAIQKKRVRSIIEVDTKHMLTSFLTHRFQESLSEQLLNAPLVKLYNTDLEIKIKETLGMDAGSSKYAGRTICLGTNGVPFKGWHYDIPDDVETIDQGWETKFLPCTFFGYLQMGLPNQVLVYQNSNDFSRGAQPIDAINFELKTNGSTTVIELNKGKIEFVGYSLNMFDIITPAQVPNIYSELRLSKDISAAIDDSQVSFDLPGDGGDFIIKPSGEFYYQYPGPDDEITDYVNKFTNENYSVSMKIKGHVEENGSASFVMEATIMYDGNYRERVISYDDGEKNEKTSLEEHRNIDLTFDVKGTGFTITNDDGDIILTLSGRGKLRQKGEIRNVLSGHSKPIDEEMDTWLTMEFIHRH